MPHEARDNGNGEIVVIEKFKGTTSFVAELNTVDSHGSLAPSVGMRHLFLTRTNALQGVKCLLNSTYLNKRLVLWVSNALRAATTGLIVFALLWNPHMLIPL